MAIDEPGEAEETAGPAAAGFDDAVTVGEYSWSDFRREEHESGPFERRAYLGFSPSETGEQFREAATHAEALDAVFEAYTTPDRESVSKGYYNWEQFRQEQGISREGFDASDYLGFDPDTTENRLSGAQEVASELADVVDERTVTVAEGLDEDAFFSNPDGTTTVVNRYDLEKAVPMEKKTHFVEQNRYWVNKPYACVVIFKSLKENEIKY